MAPSLRSRLLKPRHLLASAVVGILLGASFATALAATGGTEPGPPFSTFRVPMPAVGDRGEYEMRMASAQELADVGAVYGGPSMRTTRFEWLPGGWYANETGHGLWVDLLREIDSDDSPSRQRDYLMGREHAIGIVSSSQDLTVRPMVSTLPFYPYNQTTDFTTRSVEFGEWQPMCGLRNVFQGRSVPVDAPSRDTMTCNAVVPDRYPTMRYDLVPVRTGWQDGHRVLVVEEYWRGHYPLDADPDSVRDQAVLRWTFREDIPYPLLLEVPIGRSFDSPMQTYTLKSFERGGDPIGAPKGASPTPLPAMRSAPLAATTLDETGIQHLWPLSAAFAQAMRDDESGLKDFLAKHPGAYVHWADHASFNWSTAEETQERWGFGVTDGTASHSVEISRIPPGGGLLPMPGPVGSAYGTKFSYGDSPSPRHSDWSSVPRDLLPQTLPTVASLWEWWQAYRGPDYANEAPNDFGFMLGCPPSSAGPAPCEAAQFRAWAGFFRWDIDNDPQDILLTSAPSVYRESQIFVTSAGVIESYQERTQENNSTLASPLGGAPPPSPAGVRLAPLDGAPILSSLEAATVGFLALVATALYWLWPALKMGPAALFSRVRGDDLLRNPLRAEIHQRIEAQPGIHHQSLVRALARGNGAVEHHLRKLLDAGMVSRVQGKGYTCYFPKGRVDFRTMASAPFLKSPVARAIVEQVKANPGIRSSELARRLDVTPATVHYHVERMRSSGLLEGSLSAGALRLQVPVNTPA